MLKVLAAIAWLRAKPEDRERIERAAQLELRR
jgi:hypothetical protein